MPFQTDKQLAEEKVSIFGEYIITFISEGGQVRADFTRRGGAVVAYVSFPTGLDATNATDSYYTELWDYAREHGFSDKFKVVYTY
jgi:hypothetical protein